MVYGLILAAALVIVGIVTAVRQRRALRALADEPFLADEDRTYRRGQARRRGFTSVLLVVLGGLIANYYLSGMDARMDAIPEHDKLATGTEPNPLAEADKQFTKRAAVYWSVILGLVFVAVCFAIMDFWATRRYWMARYKEMKDDHEIKLQRDLAVYRQQRLNARVPGLKPPADDTATDEPPA